MSSMPFFFISVRDIRYPYPVNVSHLKISSYEQPFCPKTRVDFFNKPIRHLYR
jgi:hypothetical protein